MQRLACLLMLVALLAVHTGCRVSHSCRCYQPCCPSAVQEAVPSNAIEGPVLQTSRHPTQVRGTKQHVSDSEMDRIDPALPPVPEVDQEA